MKSPFSPHKSNRPNVITGEAKWFSTRAEFDNKQTTKTRGVASTRARPSVGAPEVLTVSTFAHREHLERGALENAEIMKETKRA